MTRNAVNRLSRKKKDVIIRESNRRGGPRDGWTPEMMARKEMALGPNPSGGFNHDDLGCEFFRAGYYERAVSEFKLAVRINPWKAGFKVHLARAYLAVGKDDAADHMAQAAIRQASDSPDAALAMAQVRERKGDRLQAIAWYERCLAAGPDYWIRYEVEENLKSLKANGSDG